MGGLKSYLKKKINSLVSRIGSRMMTYYNRPKIEFPHEERGIKGTFSMGEGTILQPRVIIDCSGDVTIGDDCLFIRGSHIVTHAHAYLKGYPEALNKRQAITTFPKRIGDHVFIGQEALVLPQCRRIGDWAVIGARAVVTKDVGNGEIWAGNPARKVGDRSDAGDLAQGLGGD